MAIPANFNDTQRRAVRDAARIAGLDVVRLVSESTAAAMAYAQDLAHGKIVVVADLGGGSFDVSVAEVSDGVVDVLATRGDQNLGGDDFDAALINHLADSFAQQSGIDLRQIPVSLHRLKDACEKAKIQLSSAWEADINLPFVVHEAEMTHHLQMKVGQDVFRHLTAPLVRRCRDVLLQTLQDAKIQPGDAAHVLIVGDGARIPAVLETIQRVFPGNPGLVVRSEEAVAMGAAIQGAIINGQLGGKKLLLDVMPFSLGIEAADGSVQRLVERNTTVPASRSTVVSTFQDNQTSVAVRVVEGEGTGRANRRFLGQLELGEIPPAPKGIPKIEVTFDIDCGGILTVSAKDLGTGKSNSVRLEQCAEISEDQVHSYHLTQQIEVLHAGIRRKIEASSEPPIIERGRKLIDISEATLTDANPKLLERRRCELDELHNLLAIREHLKELGILKLHTGKIHVPSQHPWRGVNRRGECSGENLRQLHGKLAEAMLKLGQFIDRMEQDDLGRAVNKQSNSMRDCTNRLKRIAEHLSKAPKMDASSLAASLWTDSSSQISMLLKQGRELEEIRNKIARYFRDCAWDVDVDHLILVMTKYEHSVFRNLRSEYRQARLQLERMLRDKPPSSIPECKMLLDLLANGISALRQFENSQNTEVGSRAFGRSWRGAESDWSELLAFHEWWQTGAILFGARELFRTLLGDEQGCQAAVARVKRLLDDFESIQSDLRDLFEYLKLDLPIAFRVNHVQDISASDVMIRLLQWEAEMESLPDWIAYATRWKKIPWSQVMDQVLQQSALEAARRYPEFAEIDGRTIGQAIREAADLWEAGRNLFPD